MNNVPEFIELPSAVHPMVIDKPAIGIDLGMEYNLAGQYIRKDGKTFVKMLKIGGSQRFGLWSGFAFDGNIIHVGDAAKLHISIRKENKQAINGAFRVKELVGAQYDQTDQKSLMFPIIKDSLGRVSFPIKGHQELETVSPEDVNCIFITAILQTLDQHLGTINPHVVITQADHISTVDATLLYGVLKLRSTDIDRMIKDSQAAILAYGVTVENHSYLVFNYSHMECFCTLVINGKPVSSVRNKASGVVLDAIQKLPKKQATENLEKIKKTLISMFEIVFDKYKKEIDGIILAGDCQDRPIIKEVLKKVSKNTVVYDEIPPPFVFVVGATVFAAKRLQLEMQVDRPLNGIIQQMMNLNQEMGIHRNPLETLSAPPTYESIVSMNSVELPPPWSPSGPSDSPSSSSRRELVNEREVVNKEIEIFRF
ncbi:hypothetical protein FO519_009691 [Halicephalobus sp. NKZ332]|nr:hypothetical protein FO519_009691 [Halicephalobus sp. NKZ332]